MEPEATRAWRALEGKLRPFVARRVASSADVDDVLQDVFVKMQRGLAGVRDSERLAPWIFQIARNVVADRHRDRARQPVLDPHAIPELPDDDGDRDDDDREAMESALASCVAHFVTLLDSPYREAITLTELEGASQKEAAEMLGISHSGMKSRVQRGRAQLRDMLEGCCAIELDTRRRVMSCEPRACPPRAECGDRDDASDA